MGGIVLMLHVANVACCNSHGWGKPCVGNNTHYGGGLTVRIVSVSELKESPFVIPRANFSLMFYCPFPKKRYICSANTETLQEPKSEVTENERHNKNTSKGMSSNDFHI